MRHFGIADVGGDGVVSTDTVADAVAPEASDARLPAFCTQPAVNKLHTNDKRGEVTRIMTVLLGGVT